MAWVTPVTDRSDGSAMMTATDLSRITGNIDYLFDYATDEGYSPSGSGVSKTSWTINDTISKSFWESMLTVLANVCTAIGYVPEEGPTNVMGYENINNVETITLTAYHFIQGAGSQQNNNHYAGDDLYAGDPINAGGTY